MAEGNTFPSGISRKSWKRATKRVKIYLATNCRLNADLVSHHVYLGLLEHHAFRVLTKMTKIISLASLTNETGSLRKKLGVDKFVENPLFLISK